MSARTVTVRVYSGEQYDSGFPSYDAKLEDVILWLKWHLEQIPEGYRSVATCEIGSTTEYDSTYATIKIEYERPETAEEIADREREERRRRENREADERILLAELLKKYGKDT